MTVKIRVALLTALLFPLFSLSQDISGVWEGSGGATSYAKICIIKWNNTYIGYTYDEGMGYCKANFIGEFDTTKKKLKGMNKGFIEKTFFHSQSRYNLTYSSTGDIEFLKGTASAKTVGAKIMSFGLPIFVTYRRVRKNVDTTEFMQNWLADKVFRTDQTVAIADSIKQIPDDTMIAAKLEPSPVEKIIEQKNERKNDTVSVITTHEKELKLTVLDNGIADKDTISIIHNNKVLLNKEEVSVKGKTFTFTLNDAEPYHEIILVAHNLGAIPPNTALVIIDTGKEKHRLTASTDLSKNAMIILKYKDL